MPTPASEMDTDAEPVIQNREGKDTAETTPVTETAHEGGTNSDKSTQEPGELDILRQQLKEANNESAARRHKIKELEDQIKARERAEMGELERLKAELADLSGADSERNELKVRFEKYEAAVQTQVQALRKDLNIPDHIALLLDEKGLADQLEYLLANRDKLAPEEKRKPEFNADKKGGGNKQTTKDKEARSEKLKQRMRLHRR